MSVGDSRHVATRSIMHFTHVRNLPSILGDGWLKCDKSVDRGLGLKVEAADLDIKASRRLIRVPLAPFGSVADYVPFYFAPRSPMLYKLHKGSILNYQEGQDPLVYLVSTVRAVMEPESPGFQRRQLRSYCDTALQRDPATRRGR